MGDMRFDVESQKLTNWICSDLDNHLPIYMDLCKEVFKEKGIDIGVSLQINDNHIYLYTADKTEMLICFVNDTSEPFIFIGGDEDDLDNWRPRTPKEWEELWSQKDNYDLPTMFEGYLHTDLDVKDTLLSHDYIMAHLRDLKIKEIL